MQYGLSRLKHQVYNLFHIHCFVNRALHPSHGGAFAAIMKALDWGTTHNTTLELSGLKMNNCERQNNHDPKCYEYLGIWEGEENGEIVGEVLNGIPTIKTLASEKWDFLNNIIAKNESQ